MQLFHYLHYGLSAILVFVGVKMLLADLYKIPIGIALGVVAGILIISVIVSLIHPREAKVIPKPGGHSGNETKSAPADECQTNTQKDN
jgi:tellurite resistance protein TerC